MHPRLILLTTILFASTTMLIAEDTLSQPNNKKTSSKADLKQFIQLVLEKGRGWTLFKDQRAPLFGYPHDGVPSKALAENGAVTENGSTRHMCNVVVQPDGTGQKPVSLVLQLGLDYPAQRKVKDWSFRFNLDGELDTAVAGVGDEDENGTTVRGSAHDTLQDIADPEVKERAKAELKFWLRTVAAKAKQETESAKQATAAPTASGSKSGKPAKPSWSDELH